MHLVRILLILAIVVGFISGYAHAENAGKVVVVVNGSELTAADLGQEVQKILPMELGFHGKMSNDKYKEVEKRALAELVDKELQYQDAVAKGLKVGKEVIEGEMEKLAARFKSKGELNKAIEGAGFTDKSLTRFFERNILAERIKRQEVNEKVKITDQIVKDYYEKNKAKYLKPEEYRASHILVKVDPSAAAEDKAKLKARVESLLNKIKEGADFGQVATENSDDMSRIKGGDLGFFHAGRVVPEFETVITTLKVGEVSGIVETIYGYHIIKLTEKKPSHQMQFDEIKEKIRTDLIEREQKQLFEQWMEGLKAKAKIIYPGKG